MSPQLKFSTFFQVSERNYSLPSSDNFFSNRIPITTETTYAIAIFTCLRLVTLQKPRLNLEGVAIMFRKRATASTNWQKSIKCSKLQKTPDIDAILFYGFPVVMTPVSSNSVTKYLRAVTLYTRTVHESIWIILEQYIVIKSFIPFILIYRITVAHIGHQHFFFSITNFHAKFCFQNLFFVIFK